MCRRRHCVSIGFLVFLGIVLGVATGLLWYFGEILFVAEMIPFAFAFAVFLFITTAILRAKYGICECVAEEKCHTRLSCMSLRKYSPLILITAAVFIVFSLVIMATFFSFTVRAILAFIGAISFWIMLPSFIAMILCVSRKCNHPVC